jgi:2-succinyl-5-enolpyruvyl-6-hydroxy-3-cyclohexene-1-carboxylate synthase
MTNKNIGILTYDHSVNYGAHLQAFALCEKLKRLGYKPHIIRWAEHYYRTGGIEHDNMKPFRDKYLPRTSLCYTEQELQTQIKDYSKIIIGGDQVFRNWITSPEQPVLRYFGDFISGNKTIASYGASFGTDTFNGDDDLVNKVKLLLKRFDKIGVREKSGVALLKNLFEVDGTEVLDPVFLLKKSDYQKLIKQANIINQQKDYIAYMVLDNDLGLGEIPLEFKNKFPETETIININRNECGEYNSVEQWLSYIENAKFVITDSFHCVAFAIIFNKPFIVVDRDFGGNSRIDNILENLDLEQCRKKSLEEIAFADLNIQIDWEKVNKIIEADLIKSEEFLDEILTIKPKYKEPYKDEELEKNRRDLEIQYLTNFKRKTRKKNINKIFSIRNEYSERAKRKVITILGAKIKFKVKDYQMKEEKKFYTVNYLISMLKAYGVKNIISSPGCQNAMFNLLVQEDPYFNCISVTDERSAAYMATGIAAEINEPVVITCTGSTASRNWIPALTEAYYRNIPIIAIPFYNRMSNEYNLSAQFVDRSSSLKDISTVKVKLSEISDITEKNKTITYLNVALSTAKYNNKPVIVEVPSILDFSQIENYKNFPKDIWTTKFIKDIDPADKKLLNNKNIAIFIGSHAKFSAEEQQTIQDFAKSYDAPVFCDHTSNYHGENKVLSAKAVISGIPKPNLIIDIGNVTGDYFARSLFDNAEVWRVTDKQELNCRYDLPVTKNFVMPEKLFFGVMKNDNCTKELYYSKCYKMIKDNNYKDLPFSNYFIIQHLAQYIPANSILHHGVSNTKRGMNFFDFDESIDISCNVGVCGIDGAVSTLVGHALANPHKRVFGIMGDLTFFYDMNVLQNRDIKNNLRILLINNNKGIEFKVGAFYAPIADKTDNLIASGGHHTCAKGWAENCGFKYMSADSSESFLNQIEDFCTKEFNAPVLFELFTKDEDEQTAFDMLCG